MKTVLLSLVFMLATLSGCAVVSKDLRVQADPELGFAQVAAQPSKYAGEIVIWGGYIIENQPDQDQSRLVVLQTPLSTTQRPQSRDESAGRFIAVHDAFLDPEIYSTHRGVTVAGKVADFTLTLDDGYGEYPVLQIKEIHLWDKPYERTSPYWRPYAPYDPWFDRPFHYRPWPSWYWYYR